MNASPIAAQLSLIDLFAKRVRSSPDAPALSHGGRCVTFRQLESGVLRWAVFFQRRGLRRGNRVALWSENRIEYVEIQLAAAAMGLIVACLNWRLRESEQLHCIRLVDPALILVSARYRESLVGMIHGVPQVVDLDEPIDFPAIDARHDFGAQVEPEDGFVILYTSGTTGLPKGAVISQRAMVGRALAYAADYGMGREDGFIAWSPFFHMAATDHSLATLLLGGHVIILDGFSAMEICRTLKHSRIGWLMAMPGVIEPLISALKSDSHSVRGVRMVGAMADLVPRHQIAELTKLLGAPYLNSFGSTETGLAPASGSLLGAAQVPGCLSKRESGWCHVRLVDAADRDVPLETPGDMLVRGPGLFSGYWVDGRIDDSEIASGWFRMGDMFVRHADGSLDFVDRSKYLIKSGGENVYPAEIERVLLAHQGVCEAVVVRKKDDRWGEVPVAFVALRDDGLRPDLLLAYCRDHLASYKVPKEIRVIDASVLPRSSTGKIQKTLLEAMLGG